MRIYSFHTKMISAEFLWGNVLLGETKKKQTSNFESFERSPYMKCRRMHLRYNLSQYVMMLSKGSFILSITFYCSTDVSIIFCHNPLHIELK